MGSSGLSSDVNIRSSPIQVTSFASPLAINEGARLCSQGCLYPYSDLLETGNRASVYATYCQNITEIHMKTKHTLALVGALLASAVGAQQTPQNVAHTAHHPAAAATSAPQTEGEIRKVDVAQGKVTLRHGPIANLDMPAMTMVFTATNPKLLDALKQGDKVRFTADKKDGAYVVTDIQVAK